MNTQVAKLAERIAERMKDLMTEIVKDGTTQLAKNVLQIMINVQKLYEKKTQLIPLTKEEEQNQDILIKLVTETKKMNQGKKGEGEYIVEAMRGESASRSLNFRMRTWNPLDI